MIFPFVTWMRRVLPRGELVAVAVAIEMLIECCYLVVAWQFGVLDEEVFRSLRFNWLLTCSVGYGVYRIVTFHPAADARYRHWLELTPWTADKPLPAGPLQLVPQDLVVIGALILMYREPSLRMLYLPTGFLVGYQLTLAIYARIIGQWGLAYLIGFVLIAVLYLVDQPESAFAMADACFVIGRIAVSRALRSFPWKMPWQLDLQSIEGVPAMQTIQDEQKRRQLGWPFDQLSPKSPERRIPFHDGICLSLMAGWLWFVVLSKFASEPLGFLPLIMIVAILVAAAVRLSNFQKSHYSPLNFMGRLWTFRWLIPSYDQVYVAPLLAFAVIASTQGMAALMLAPGQNMFGLQMARVYGITLASLGATCAWLIVLVMGPVLESWQLAAKHRIAFNSAASARQGDQFVEL